MSNFDKLYNDDKQLKQSIINNVITPDKSEAYINAADNSIDDLMGVMEAYKHGSITNEDQVQEQIKIFLEEYTVKLLTIVKGE
ncbi:hypothetical protein [Paenibacillus silvae]|uniref:Uncharacterized protein n=1 Tax=Paenibacillus silvae TaxID=1325358 RepID=A0A2W6NQD3_9BACL|nr:hypothetical protein [Paenibacillus silvae]PZT57478.1 hypothetical protein DN757_02140 [Paenibacillus silvae]